MLGGLLLVPLSVLGCGLVTHYVPGKVGLALNLVLFFFNGLGVGVFPISRLLYMSDDVL
jgi:hypothetical protein